MLLSVVGGRSFFSARSVSQFFMIVCVSHTIMGVFVGRFLLDPTAACNDGELLAVAEMAFSSRWDDAGRRAALGALVPLTRCGSFGYVADTNITVDGRSSDGLLCLELVVVDAAAGVVGAKVHMAPYVRTKKRFGKDAISIDAFVEFESPAFGGFVGELATLWNLEGDRGRLGAMNVLSETGVEMSDVHPALQADLEQLLVQHA